MKAPASTGAFSLAHGRLVQPFVLLSREITAMSERDHGAALCHSRVFKCVSSSSSRESSLWNQKLEQITCRAPGDNAWQDNTIGEEENDPTEDYRCSCRRHLHDAVGRHRAGARSPPSSPRPKSCCS